MPRVPVPRWTAPLRPARRSAWRWSPSRCRARTPGPPTGRPNSCCSRRSASRAACRRASPPRSPSPRARAGWWQACGAERERRGADPERVQARGGILLVDDNETNRLFATTLLNTMGYTVETAEDGAQAIEAVRLGFYDAVLMDVQMPGVDGVQATRAIRA